MIPELEISPKGGDGNPLQYSCLENSTDREAWSVTVQRITKSQTRVKQFSTHAHLFKKKNKKQKTRINKQVTEGISGYEKF